MTSIQEKVLTTVNAPYRAKVNALELSEKIVDPKSVISGDASAFAFFSEVATALQRAFIVEMNLNMDQVQSIAKQFSLRSGYAIPLAS